MVYSPDAVNVVGGPPSGEHSDDYYTDFDKLCGISESILEKNGPDAMYYIMVFPTSTVELEAAQQYREAHPDLNTPDGKHSFEEHVAHKQADIDRYSAVLKEHGITDLKLEWLYYPEDNVGNYVDRCPAITFYGYVSGEKLLSFQRAMEEYFSAHYYDGAEFPSNAMGGDVYLMPYGYTPQNYYYGVVAIWDPEGGGWGVDTIA